MAAVLGRDAVWTGPIPGWSAAGPHWTPPWFGGAQAALEAARAPGVDPASSLLICDAAAAALPPDLDMPAREQAESDLRRVLALIPLAAVEPYQDRVELARRLHNDAVITALALRRRRTVVWFRLAGHAREPRTFEMSAERRLTWAGPSSPAGERRWTGRTASEG